MMNNGTGPLILIIEDDTSLRDLFCEALDAEGYSTCIAANGMEGLERFDEVNPDLVLMDLLMPRMNGWETLERVRRISECPVIIVTGQGTTENIIRGLLEAGADDYLVKPFGVKELIARVDAVLRRSVPAFR
jgi:two-component system response regulator ResD